MHKISQVNPTANWQLEKETTNQLPIANCIDSDRLYEELGDLTNPQYRTWYCGKFNRLGRERVLRLASQARADAKKDKRRLFSYLLKKETN